MASELSAAGTGVRIAQAVGILGSAFISGGILSLSWISVPVVLRPTPYHSSHYAAIQWADLYHRGAMTMPALAFLACSAYFFLSWNNGGNQLYATAGLLTIGIVPWTFATMMGTIGKLEAKIKLGEKAKETVAAKDYETEDLIKKWSLLNAVRGGFPLAGAVVGLFALLTVG
ncbi:hypothetical protein VNI00_009505 [Paramarasmius palmivorus]|uniref:DUF1772-domain-containing protein n=1 Tax=Paramarasmius palmivorus TaxID=297713 RepID=A0AAW0CLY4_9AGAR